MTRSRCPLTAKLAPQLPKVGDFLSDGALCFARLKAKGQHVPDWSPEAEFTSLSFIKSLGRIEAGGKSLGEIRAERWSHITVLRPVLEPPNSPPEDRDGHTDLAKRYFQVWTLSKKKEQLLCTPDCDSGERNPRTDFWDCWLPWLSTRNSGIKTGSTCTYLKWKEREVSWGKGTKLTISQSTDLILRSCPWILEVLLSPESGPRAPTCSITPSGLQKSGLSKGLLNVINKNQT